MNVEAYPLEFIDSQLAELDYYKKIQEEERNFGFKPQFDTQGNSNLAQKIDTAQRRGDEDIDIILAEHDYVRSSALKYDNLLQPTKPTGQLTRPSSSCGKRPGKDKPSRPDKSLIKINKLEVNIKEISDFTDIIKIIKNNLPLILLLVLILFVAYKMYNSPLKGSKGKKGKGKGKGKKK